MEFPQPFYSEPSLAVLEAVLICSSSTTAIYQLVKELKEATGFFSSMGSSLTLLIDCWGCRRSLEKASRYLKKEMVETEEIVPLAYAWAPHGGDRLRWRFRRLSGCLC